MAGFNVITEAYVEGTLGESAEPFKHEAAARADERFRKTLFASLGANPGPTQRQIVESSPGPTAVVKGGAEPIVTVDYVETVRYGNLWQKHCYRLAGSGTLPSGRVRESSTLCWSAFSRMWKAAALQSAQGHRQPQLSRFHAHFRAI
jgi:hypothetical protein